MDNVSLAIRELYDLNDNLLLPWLDLYETAFPPEERNLVSDMLRPLKAESAAGRNQHLLAATSPTGQLLGIAMYSCAAGHPVAIFWYLAMAPEARGHGYGSQFYQDIVRRVRAAGCKCALLEVEIPERTTTAEARNGRRTDSPVPWPGRPSAARRLILAGGRPPPCPASYALDGSPDCRLAPGNGL